MTFESQCCGGPEGRVAERIARGQSHPHAHAVDHRPVLTEEGGLVAPGCEVSQGIRWVDRQEFTDPGLVRHGHSGLDPLRMQHRPDGRYETQGKPQTHQVA